MLTISSQVLHNKAAKIVLNRSVHSSSTQTLILLRWISLRVRRRIRRLVHTFDAMAISPVAGKSLQEIKY